ncbi:hypothetical protein PROFUN_10346 [Planoprotostelium fungivorum]|uniref:Maf-like protein n=1 Tax=Planoprotostelium fungivorum TaxID=1890364 RepID=A0A2P6NDV1_9EUKA|nr:hypothetical protein PROFUN_14495 [Planoprotostelium fungivorum]PRP82138.1 hypothetical protein PROFUN_10346 [Planoprotostelium fungivorum]
MTTSHQVILGSSSIWRRQVVESLGYKCQYMSPDIDEKAIRHPDPEILTRMISEAKAAALVPKIKEPSFLITGDQVVTCEGVIREKPEDAEECRTFLRSYRTHPATCVSSLRVTDTSTGKFVEGTEKATQYFKEIPEELIEELISHGDVMSCAGGFIIERMEPYLGDRIGHESAIKGMPEILLERLMQEIKSS